MQVKAIQATLIGKICGTRLSSGETITKTEHTWGEWEKTSDATVFAAQKEKESVSSARPQKKETMEIR